MQTEVYESRTKKYLREGQASGEKLQVQALEAELDDSERRNLRLMKELLDETTLRARAERSKDDILERFKILQDEMEEADRRLNGKAIRPQRIGKDRSDIGAGRAVSQGAGLSERPRRKVEEPVLTDARGNAVPEGSKPVPGSSRKRGGMK